MRATRGFRPRMAKRVSYLSCRPCARFPYHACARVSCQPRARVVLPHTRGSRGAGMTWLLLLRWRTRLRLSPADVVDNLL